MLSEGTELQLVEQTQNSHNFELAHEPNTDFSNIDWAFVKSIFEFQSYIFPLTTKKMCTWFSYLTVATSLYFLSTETEIFDNVLAGLREEIIALTVLIYGLEPMMIFLYMSLAKYPYFEPEVHSDIAAPLLNDDAVLIVPCHLSAKTEEDRVSLKRVLDAALKHFKADHIFMIDNGRAATPQDETKGCIDSVNSAINYKYYPNPNKTTALYVGLQMAKARHQGKIKYALFTDDDVEIPKNFYLQRSFFDDLTVRGIIYPLTATSILGRSSLVVNWQNLEYQLSDLSLAAFDATQTAPAPHGACMVLEVNTAEKIFDRHTGLFKGEDKEVGDRLRNLYDPAGILKFRVDMNCHFKTNVPESYFGAGGNLWGQRVRSWSEAPFLYFWRLTLKPVISDWRHTPLSLPIVKLDQIYNLISQLSHVFRYSFIALEVRNPFFWLTFVSLMLMQMSAALLFNYGKLPPYLRNDFKSVITFPLYKQIDNFLAHMAFWRVFLFTYPNETSHPPIKALMDAHKIPDFNFDLEAQTWLVESTEQGDQQARESQRLPSLRLSEAHRLLHSSSDSLSAASDLATNKQSEMLRLFDHVQKERIKQKKRDRLDIVPLSDTSDGRVALGLAQLGAASPSATRYNFFKRLDSYSEPGSPTHSPIKADEIFCYESKLPVLKRSFTA